MNEQKLLDKFKEFPTEKTLASEQKLQIGIIGTGWIAEVYAEVASLIENMEICALADLIPGKAEAFKQRFGFEKAVCYLSHQEMIDNHPHLDAVFVCTYNRTHAESSIYALEHGIHVLCEKPMCVTLEEAVQMRRAEKNSGKILSIGFQPRLDPNMKKIKEIVDSGLLGKIYYIQTGGGRRRGIPTPFGTTFIEEKTAGIGAMGDIGCYSLDMILNAIGYPKPLTVSGYTSNFFGKRPEYYPAHPEYAKVFEVEDFAAGFIRLEGDIILDFRIAWAMNLDTPGDTIIMGTKGSLRIPSTECWNGSVGGAMTLYSEMAGAQVQTEFPILPAPANGVFYEKVRSFLNAIILGEKSPIPSEQIIINQAIIDGIVRSATIGKEIEINIPEV